MSADLDDALWTLDDDGILDAIGTSVSPGVAHAVRTLIAGYAATPGDDRGRELADEINARADEADPPVATVGMSTLRRWATTVRALAAPAETAAVVHDPTTEDEAALRSKLDEWLAEDGISPYRRTAFVQVLEWLDAHGTASGDDER